MSNGVCINVGCGSSPTAGWLNYDGSPTIKLGRHAWLCFLLDSMGFLDEGNRRYISFVRNSDIKWADAAHLPHSDGTVDVIYSSHMLEHLDKDEAKEFLAEARRVLRPGGIIRLSVPDLSLMVSQYCQNGNADRLLDYLQLAQQRPKGVLAKLKWLFVTNRNNHRWMYDSRSLAELLSASNFGESQ
jgi:ubiquinone/menaquinone biosynthesis C-methylase UbiE